MWNRRKTTGAVAAATLLLAMAGTAVSASAASAAAPPWGSCPKGQACLYKNLNGKSTKTVLDCGLTFLGPTVVNATKSAWNRTPDSLYLFDSLIGAGQPDILDVVTINDPATAGSDNKRNLDADAQNKVDYAFYPCHDEDM